MRASTLRYTGCSEWLRPSSTECRWKSIMIDEAGSPSEPRWLLWAREMQALAQTGLAFTHDQYDRERYQQLRALAAQIMAEHTAMAMPDIEVMFTQQTGYATPKLGVRGAVFHDDRI